jgi:hypothetical protein
VSKRPGFTPAVIHTDDAAVEPPQPNTDTYLDALFQAHAVERGYNGVAFQMMFAVVTVLFTYMIAVSGIASGKCGHVAAFSPAGCSAVSPSILWAAPAPVIALLAFLTPTQALLELAGIYINEIEREIDARLPARPESFESRERLVVPQGMRHVVSEVYGRLPFGPGPLLAYLFTYVLAVAFTVGAACLMPWGGGDEPVSWALCGVYGLLLGYIAFMHGMIIARRRSRPWTLLYRTAAGEIRAAEAASRRPGVRPGQLWARPEPRAGGAENEP